MNASTNSYSGVDFYALDDLLSPEDLALRSQVRDWVERNYLPGIADWNERFGAFGGNIQGYGCAGLSPLRYGLVMQELERGDTGLRTLASVQGALAMNAIHMFGSEEQKQHWLPEMAAGNKLGCFGLTEPDFGSNPAGMTTTATRTPQGYVLNGRKTWIGLANTADIAVIWAKVDGLPGIDPTSASAVRGFLVSGGTPGFHPSVIDRKLSM
ncbi:MAG: acyl-CoA dehydrogenase family protein, partial [Planctomycetota bacterium]|nr:acyl-CoA dehydrogenase family protein [Planctomycetota bacterium]